MWLLQHTHPSALIFTMLCCCCAPLVVQLQLVSMESHAADCCNLVINTRIKKWVDGCMLGDRLVSAVSTSCPCSLLWLVHSAWTANEIHSVVLSVCNKRAS